MRSGAVRWAQGKSGKKMSQTATSAREEGVLTSIRHIARATSPVSLARDETHEGPDRQTHASGSGAKRAGDPLILTQDYRVPESNVLTLTPDQQVPAGETGKAASPEPERARQSSQEVRDLIAKITALETAIADTVDQWEPDDTGRGPYAGTASPVMAWPALGARDSQVPEAVQPAASAQAGPPDEIVDEQVVDEAALRALVAEVVREELQGALGQRISRNVRKVIRQEIRRALAAEALR
jgi:hypothetical protein